MQKAVVPGGGSLADRSRHELDADDCSITGVDYRQKWWLTVLGFALLGLTWLTVAGLVDGFTVLGLTYAGLTVAGLTVAMQKAAVKAKEQGGGSLDDSLHTVLLSILAGVTIFAVAFACGAGVILAGLAEPAQPPLSPWLTEERLCGLDGSVWQNGVIVDA